ncbi:hypothetical protein [Aureimonas leprariae]|nr:hypothetical protein [Aureimonas leprariae]
MPSQFFQSIENILQQMLVVGVGLGQSLRDALLRALDAVDFRQFLGCAAREKPRQGIRP